MDISEVNNKVHGLFLSWLTSVVMGGILAALAMVVVIDPYNLYGLFVFDGINSVKPELSRHVEEIKLTQAAKLKPDTLILGNSRAEIGFDPESPVLVDHGFSTYNLAIRGTNLALASRQLDYLLRQELRPKRIILALDFIDFMQLAPMPSSNTAHTGEGSVFPVEQWFWRFDSLFSMASIKDSLRTLAIQRDEEAATTTVRGFNPLKEYAALARNEGYYVLFRQRVEENARIYLKKSAGSLDQSQIKLFRSVLERSVGAGSEVIVVIYPYHAQIMALFERTGLLPAFVEWKLRIASELADLSSQQGSARISLFDFSGYGAYQCEPIPKKGDLHGVSRWYWEGGHFKKALGDVVLARIFSETSAASDGRWDSDVFGAKLTLENFDSNLERMARERERCNRGNPQIFEEVKLLVESLTSK